MEHTTTQASVPGNHYYFKVVAYNPNGEVFSESAGFTVGKLPPTPANAPESIASLTSSTMLAISVETIAVDAETPVITSYSIEVDDGLGGELVSIYGTLSASLSTTYNVYTVTKGRIYRVRYRVQNAIGWSDYSPIGYLRVADVPVAPPPAIIVSTSATQIALALRPTEENGGAEIIGYELWIDDGDLGETYTRLQSYDGLAQSFVIDTAVETTLVQGKVYRIKMLAKNEMGLSEFSDLISVALSDPPSKPDVPTKNTELSTVKRLVIDWV